jgi:hypothetical protein
MTNALDRELVITVRCCTALASRVAFERGVLVAPVCWLPERMRRIKAREPERYVDVAWRAAWAYWIQDFKLKAVMNSATEYVAPPRAR